MLDFPDIPTNKIGDNDDIDYSSTVNSVSYEELEKSKYFANRK